MIKFNKVAKRFRRVEVLKGIELEIARGDRVALVGSNGAGKTTLIRCLLGEYLCDGEVLVDGLDPRDSRAAVLKRIGFVPQLPPPLKMPVGQLLRFSASVCGADRARMEEVSRRLGLDPDEVKHRPFVKLSGGQKQKLLISIALGRESDILILDEPAANLDPEARHIFFQLLAEKREESAMLISSHRLDEVASLVNRVIEMDQGNVVLDDRVADLVALSSRLDCRLTLTRAEPAFAKAIAQWGFSDGGAGLTWHGMVAGPDRLRFLGVLSRYAGLLASIQLDEQSEEKSCA
ncbi:ABC transporter [Solemya pervernicosa gill symbiont]|uniref:ABC transporter n=2 Tax=Gammaproteobacteria incertae sedis TaxID=118884 RepID=A0A1T2LB66_9GAMM|nr:ABC transporter ATP-binding protein [Candidatus Reidiella endopervernicosa]OOZ42358.1 ABC transporter [Solemya pervernicosa gill symbiont]QKQ25747.1 ABC transporter ATP-binding protein [Candidatus Reidiella endopervernicosa]